MHRKMNWTIVQHLGASHVLLQWPCCSGCACSLLLGRSRQSFFTFSFKKPTRRAQQLTRFGRSATGLLGLRLSPTFPVRAVCRFRKRFRLNTRSMISDLRPVRHLTFHVPSLCRKAFAIFLFDFQFLALQYLENRKKGAFA